MKSSSLAKATFVLVAGFAVACSSSPSHPPVDTNGGNNPGATTGGAQPKSDGGITDAGSLESGIPIPPGAEAGGSVCTPTNCSGCCDPTNGCQTGTLSGACGILGSACVTCPMGTLCTGGGCQ